MSLHGSDVVFGEPVQVADGRSAVRKPTKRSKDKEPEPHDGPSALLALRQHIANCDGRKQAPQWWQKVSPLMTACVDVLDAVLSSRPVPRAANVPPDSDDEEDLFTSPSRQLSEALADLKSQNAQVIDALGKMAPAMRLPRVSAAPPAPGPHFRQPAFCVTVALADVPADAPVRRLSLGDVKAAIDSALRKSAVPALHATSTHSVRRDRSRIFVHATSAEHRTALVKFPDEWLVALGPGVKLARRRISLQVDLVNTKFTLHAATALDALYLTNPTVIASRDHLEDVRWIHGTKAPKSGRSSLVLIVSDADTARAIIHEGLCVLGEYCPAYVQPPVVRQCFRCQGFGHETSQCTKQSPSRPLACGRCASSEHATSGCICPSQPPCIVMRTCTHIKVRCANCHGDHKAFDAFCPLKAEVLAKALASPSYIALTQELQRVPL